MFGNLKIAVDILHGEIYSYIQNISLLREWFMRRFCGCCFSCFDLDFSCLTYKFRLVKNNGKHRGIEQSKRDEGSILRHSEGLDWYIFVFS